MNYQKITNQKNANFKSEFLSGKDLKLEIFFYKNCFKKHFKTYLTFTNFTTSNIINHCYFIEKHS